MFTGIIRHVGSVTRFDRLGPGARLAVDAGPLAGDVARGDSVAVAGACLTATAVEGTVLVFDVSRETLDRTTVGTFRPGRRVNLELALRASDRLGGHFVLGHVDVVGTVRALTRRPGDTLLEVGVPPEVGPYLVEKGSVAVDGVSLTLASAAEDGFRVALVPETLQGTTLAALARGDAANVEADILAKTVARYLARLSSGGSKPSGGLTLDDLSSAGFL